MILLTGGAGFIGSVLHGALVRRGQRCVVVDRLRADGKWRNLGSRQIADFVPPASEILARIGQNGLTSVTMHDGSVL